MENLSDYLYMFAAIALLAVLFWFGAREFLVNALMHSRNMALYVVGFFNSDAEVMRQQLAVVKDTIPAKQMEYDYFKSLASTTGYYARWFWVVPVFGVIIYNLFKGNKMSAYRRKLTPETLAKAEMKIWPEITPVVGLNLTKGDITKGPWAVAKNEREFVETAALLKEGGELDKAKTRAIYVRQLGRRWRGPQALPIYARAIYAICSLYICGDRKEALSRARSIAAEHGPGESGSIKNVDFSWVDETIANYKGNEILERIHARHAYERTVLATMLQVSRADGVLAASLFVWLRPVDRVLWYVLDGVGRYTFFAECAGVLCHWLFEKTIGEMSIVPIVDVSIAALEEALAEFIVVDNVEAMLR